MVTRRRALVCALALTSTLMTCAQATPCNTFAGWIAAGSATTSVKCVTPTPTGFTIPDAFAATLTNLNELVLSVRGIGGSITSLTSLTKLTKLVLRRNLLSGPVPDLSALSLLQVLDLSDNPTFTPGPIPDKFATLSNLTILDLSATKRTSTLPTSLETLSKLRYFEVEHNNITGTIMPGLATLPLLEVFEVASNQFTGELPKGLVTPALVSLHVEHNQFSGSLDGHGFPEATFIQLRVTNNRMFGPMPSFDTYIVGEADVTVGESLGNFIANGASCAGRTSDCSSGVSRCGKNEICCVPVYAAPHERAVCVSGICGAGTGACICEGNGPCILPQPTASPTNLPSSLTRTPTAAPSSTPSAEPFGGLAPAPSVAPSPIEGSQMLIPILSGVGMVALALGFVMGRHRRKQHTSFKGSSAGVSQGNWSPNPKYLDKTFHAGTFSSAGDSSTLRSTQPPLSVGPHSFTSMASSGVVPASFRGRITGVLSVSPIDV